MHCEITTPDLPECKSCPLTFAYQEIELLYQIAVNLNSTFEIIEMIEKGMKLLQRHTHIERCALFLTSVDKKELELSASINLSPQQRKIATYRFGEGATGLAAQSGEPIVIENVHNNIDYLNKLGSINAHTVSYVAIPLIKDDEVTGVFSANISKDCPMNFDDLVRLLTIVGSLFAGSMIVQKCITKEKEELQELKSYYKAEALQEHQFNDIIGQSIKMKQIFSMIDTVAPTDATILVRGETGTGKELIATAVHNTSLRKNGPFIKLNCAAISETLLESELFGHEKGAFTDAKEMRKGRFELADGGTLFLDEIGDITSALQVKLLRILQEQEFERVGGSKTVKTNVRLVAATNRNLEEMVKNGEFREDLFYRLNVIPLNLPPLRERYEDVKLLIMYYMKKFIKEHRKQMTLSKTTLETLLDYPWPGNIRELQNTMERLVLICPDGEVVPEMLNHVLPFNYQKMHMEVSAQPEVAQEIYEEKALHVTPQHEERPIQPLTKSSMQDMEKEAIIQALIDHRGIQTKAARQLGMTARQIGYKIKKYEIDL
ncbi:MAG: sigma 54-interacting transcriptional regulator [Campylobacterota bacterium]|nr:sigma 54-interacting transcriptional regulator [Campylobacterota bacterium]